MPSLLARATRSIYRREAIPASARWWLAASGMRGWFHLVASRLRPHLGDRARPILARVGARMLERRYAALREARPSLPDPKVDGRAIGLSMSALYLLWSAPKSGWIVGDLGGPPRGLGEQVRAQALIAGMSSEERWREVTVHLGELLIALTQELPRDLPHARKILSDICFDFGARFGEKTRRAFGMEARGEAATDDAIEILRMSEYIFRVNPEHWKETDRAAGTGSLTGTACPWYDRPGWEGAHCGIFGQFQAGISSVFGLRYNLATTIPKHGGSICKIDLKPIPLRRKDRPLEGPGTS
ncbi:MAG TPA: hypothetical protein VE093_37870 [Polyangiaceae bacterium]|jgi:hypothetical protein|nr:hypothetical protein [Polyangiaceae bacterium]